MYFKVSTAGLISIKSTDFLFANSSHKNKTSHLCSLSLVHSEEISEHTFLMLTLSRKSTRISKLKAVFIIASISLVIFFLIYFFSFKNYIARVNVGNYISVPKRFKTLFEFGHSYFVVSSYVNPT